MIIAIGSDYYFIESFYDDGGNVIESRITKYDQVSPGLVEFRNAKGYITRGAIVEDTLYYTAYNEDTNDYTIYSIDRKDFNATPKAERTLEWDEIYSQNGELYTVEGGYLVSGDKSIKGGSENYFVGDDLLVEYVIDSQASLTAVLIDTATGEELLTAVDIIDFTVSGPKLTFYCHGSIQEYDRA
ncbi:MAG: hypothetical protein FWF71_04805 [Actinomycetia bacterium]|nr:hypothetical protein [Actinomycetes bacterium]